MDAVIRVFSLFGLAFLLFLAGLEIDFDRLRGAAAAPGRAGLRGLAGDRAARGRAAVGDRPGGGRPDRRDHPLGHLARRGRAAAEGRRRGREPASASCSIAAASIADFATIILLTLFFSREATGTGTKLLLLAGFVVLAGVAVARPDRAGALAAPVGALVRLQDTTAQIRVRGAFLLMAAFVALAERLGLEVILGAFTAGAILSLVDRDALMTHPALPHQAGGRGSASSSRSSSWRAASRSTSTRCSSSASTLLRVPLFLAALLVVRGVPAAPLPRARSVPAAPWSPGSSRPRPCRSSWPRP